MADDVTIRIGAQDNASKTLDAVQKKADKLDKEKVELTVDAKISKAFDALDKVADRTKKVQGAADALADALGPELAGRVDLTKTVRDFERMGISIDEIVDNADKLGGKLKELDGVRLSGAADGLDKVSTGFHNAAKDVEGFKAGAVNSAADLTAVFGGTASQAINDFGQSFVGAAELAGPALATMGISVESLMGPLALVGIAIGGLKALWDANKKKTQENTKAAQEWSKAIKDAHGNLKEVATKKLADVITDDQIDKANRYNITFKNLVDVIGGKTSAQFDALRDKAQKYQAITDQIAAANARGDVFTSPLSPAALADLKQASDDYKDLGGVVTDLGGHLDAGAASLQKHTDFVGDAADAADDAKAAIDRFAAAQDKLNTSIEDGTKAMEDQIQSWTDRVSAAQNWADLGQQLKKADEDVAAATQKTIDTNKDVEATAADKAKALDDEIDQVISAGKIQAEYRHQQELTMHGVDSATQQIDEQNRSLEEQARNSTPAAKRAVYEYLIQLNLIPEEKATEILAAVDKGDIETANKLIDEASATRTATINVDANTDDALKKIAALGAFIRDQFAGVADLPVLDAGGKAPAFGGIAGERRPEILNERYLVTRPTWVPPGTRVTSGAKTARILKVHRGKSFKMYDRGGTVPRTTVMQPTINVQAAVIGNTFDVMNAVNTAMRRAERLLPRHP